MKYLTLILGILFIAFFAYTSKNAIDSCQEYEQLDSYNDVIIAAMFPEQKETIKTVIYQLFPKSSKYWGYETDDINYLNGQILLPDGIHSDTLKIVDAALLNYCNRYYEYQCDGDILDVINSSTVKYTLTPKILAYDPDNDTCARRSLYFDYQDSVEVSKQMEEWEKRYHLPKHYNTIIEQQTDERGLISVIYTQNGKELALDYLTRHEYDSVFHNYVNYRP